MIPRVRLFPALFASLAAALATPANAQQAPPQETGTPIVSLRYINSGAGFQLVDAADGTMIFDGTGTRIFEFQDPEIEFSTDLRAQPTGFDLVITCSNPTGVTHRLGSFVLGSFMLGQHIQYRDFRYAGKAIDADYLSYVVQAHLYPDSMYSPVWTLSNDRYTVGLSFLYPVLAYRHDVRVGMGSPAASADPRDPRRGWLMEFRVAAHGDEVGAGVINYSAELSAGESRTYVIAVRVMRNPGEWIRTLTPYRNYFRDLYGGVKYQRDPRPVRPVLISSINDISPQNPNGFGWNNARRPDVFGWRPWVNAMLPLAEQWGRLMIWAPSGLYNRDLGYNYPYQFTSHWLDDPETATATDPVNGLPVVGAACELGLWWGFSSRVATVWNPTAADVHPFDPDNPNDVAAGFRELDLAAQAGATCVGLDTFSHYMCPSWKLHRWLRMMKARHPQIKFVVEAVASDILHNEAATYLCGYNFGTPNGPGDLYPVGTPHYLADFVNPGHEIWIAYFYNHQREYGIAVTPSLVESDARRFASWGYVPLMFEDFIAGPQDQAAESWLNTVPQDLQQSVQWNTRYNRAMAVRDADGRLTIIAGSEAPRPDAPHGAVVQAHPSAGPQQAARSTFVDTSATTRAGQQPGAAPRAAGRHRSVPSPAVVPPDQQQSPPPDSVPAVPPQSPVPAPPPQAPLARGPAPPMPASMPADLLRRLIDEAVKRARGVTPTPAQPAQPAGR